MKYNDKPYYKIRSIHNGEFMFFNNDVGVERQGIYANDLKSLIMQGKVDVMNLAINANGSFYERNPANTPYGDAARKDIGSICYQIGSVLMKKNPPIVCKYTEKKITKKDDFGFLAEGLLNIADRYTLVLKKDYLGCYYLYDGKNVCVEGVRSKKQILEYMKEAVVKVFGKF